MRKVFLPFFLIFIFHICSAPIIDFNLRMLKFRSVEKKYHDSEFSRLIKDLGYSESGNNWLSVNQIGCFGEWQFSESTLKYLGYRKVTLKKFKANPWSFPREVQLEALNTLIRLNLILLTDYEHFIGDSIRGVIITKSGMIAASHLGGAGSLMKFLDSKGKIDKKDVLGTSISDYMKKFGNYGLE